MKTPKLDRLREMREANFLRAQIKSRAALSQKKKRKAASTFRTRNQKIDTR
jgi:hypothetical protein